VRSLGRHGIPVWLVRDDHALANASRYTRRSLAWPAADEARRVEYLVELGRRYALDGWAVSPTDDEGAALLARNREILGQRYLITVPSWETLRWAYDKRLTYRIAADLGVDHPRTHYPANRDDVLAYDGRYPAILKPAIRAELNSFTVSKAWPADDAPGLVARYEEAIALVEPALIMVQEVIPGGGEAQLSFAALCRDGGDTRGTHADARVAGLAPRSDGVRDPRGRRSASRRRRDPIRSASRLAPPNARSPDRGGTSRPACRHRRPLRKLLAVMRLIELGDRGWLEFVQGRADATLFHHPVWARLLADC